MRKFSCCIGTGIAIAVLHACSSTEPLSPNVHLHFVLDAPLCSSIIPVAFYVDGAVVGTDTFRVHLQPNHTESNVFSVAAGKHVLGARTFGSFPYVWRDTNINATSKADVIDTLPFYCS